MTVKVAIIGTGWGTRIQVPAFRHVGMDVVGLWARSEEKAKQTANEHSIPFATSDYKALLAHKEIDLVSVVTPPYTHAEISIAALEVGKHVLCEKPTAMNKGEAEKMLQAARRHPRLIALIDHELRFNPTRQKMKKLIAEGYVGEVYHVESAVLSATMLNPKRLWNWWMEKDKGGGLWGAAGSHAIDALTWLLGRRVIGIEATLRTFIKERLDADGKMQKTTSDDYCLATMKFEGEISGTMQLSAVTTGVSGNRVLVVGSKGSLLFEGEKLTGYRTDSTAPEPLTVEVSNECIPDVLKSSEFPRHTITIAQALKTAIELGDHSSLAPAATFEDGVYIQKVLDAGYESSEKNVWVKV
ncbi:MAG: Gfo/Idh/MocA family oxidoreductase [Chloroflexi bacterium]|nr:Gfo/Idh/MocA family oxidoreductase [Chloroflexota bacterium]